MAWLLDLDGVVWLSGRPIPGSAGAVATLRAAGERVLFVTNHSAPTVAAQEARLAAIGIEAAGDVVTSAVAAASVLPPGTTALVVGGDGVREALLRRGVTPVDDAPADAVVVGLTESFDYELLRRAATAVRSGARLVGTNDDATMPTPDGQLPGAGALLAAVATASGAEPLVAGKPHQPMADVVLAVAGAGPHLMVGDRWSTDGLFAQRLGARFGLVLSGVTPASAVPALATPPDLVAADLAALVAAALPRHHRESS